MDNREKKRHLALMAKHEGNTGEKWYTPTPQAEPAWTVSPGFTPDGRHQQYNSLREKYENWFLRPLTKFEGDDVFVCLMVMLPLIEKFVRYQVKKAGGDSTLDITQGGKLAKQLDKLLGVADNVGYEFWRAFRNGLLHKAVAKDALSYVLHPETNAAKAVKMEDATLHVYVWVLRDLVVQAIRSADREMWTKDDSTLPTLAHPSPGA